MSVLDYVISLGQSAKVASRAMARASTAQKNHALSTIAHAIFTQKKAIQAANAEDVEEAFQTGLSDALLDRLKLSQEMIDQMAQGVMDVVNLADPIGEILHMAPRPNGLQVGQMRVPLGVVGMIYESRPNVTIDAAALCIKSGNAVILRGGSEALRANQLLASIIQTGLAEAHLPQASVQVVEKKDRAIVGHLVTLSEYIDVIVPRGGKELIARLMKESTIPMIKHLDGICHVYIDSAAEVEKAVNIAFNAKCQRYGTCNTMETLLVHASIAKNLLTQLMPLYEKESVELRVCDEAYPLLEGYPKLCLAQPVDWATEYLAPILSIKIVHDIDEAMAHIDQYGSRHTEAIVTEDYSKAMRFLKEVDAGSVMVNASTRFADGYAYGLGAEIGIATDKLHARGPVGLNGLTSLKYVVLGQGQVRSV